MAPQSPRNAISPRTAAIGLLAVRIGLGVYFAALGFEKIDWLFDSAPLAQLFERWLAESTPASRWYLDRLMPGVPVFARAVPLGEIIGGVALAVGFWTRIAASVLLVLMLNFHVAAAALFRPDYLSDAGGLPLLAALLGLLIGGGSLPFSARR